MLKNMKIRSRLLISYLLITVLLLIVGIVSIVMLREESSRLQEFYNQQFQTVENALDMRRTVFSVRGNILSSIVEYNDDTVDSAKSDFQSLFTLLNSSRTMKRWPFIRAITSRTWTRRGTFWSM